MKTSKCASASGSGVESRRPVASNVPITEKEFWLRVETARNALVSEARRRVGYDAAEDVTQTAILQAEGAFRMGRYTDPTEEKGPSAFTGWLMKILRDCCVNHVRSTTRRSRYETRFEFGGGSRECDSSCLGNYKGHTDFESERRWAMLACEDDRAALADLELLHEARQRAAHADLTEDERWALQGRLEKRKLADMSKELRARARAAGSPDPEAGTSLAAISRTITRAIDKLKSVPADVLAAPDLDIYAWRIANDVTIYRSPTTTGSGLAREQQRLTDAQFQKLPQQRNTYTGGS